METFNEKFRNRTQQLALQTIEFYGKLNGREENRIMGKQLLRSATSVAANFRAATRPRSEKEYYAKLSIVVEETDETSFWLELLLKSGLVSKEIVQPLLDESYELTKVFASTRKTIKTKKDT